MKRILIMALIMFVVLGVNASQSKGHGENDFAIDLLRGSPEFNLGKNNQVEMSRAFMVTQKETTNKLFGSFWVEFEYEESDSADKYNTKNWNVIDIRLGDNLSEEELKIIEELLYDKLSGSCIIIFN